jgi:ATP-dependent Clp protease ATP-binding subunit ClpX
MIGRLPVNGALTELDADALLTILTEPKNALVKQYVKLMEMEGVALTFSEDSLREIVEIALSRRTGARALRAIMEDVMLDIMFKAPSMSNVKSITVTKDTVLKKSEPEYVFTSSKKRA